MPLQQALFHSKSKQQKQTGDSCLLSTGDSCWLSTEIPFGCKQGVPVWCQQGIPVCCQQGILVACQQRFLLAVNTGFEFGVNRGFLFAVNRGFLLAVNRWFLLAVNRWFLLAVNRDSCWLSTGIPVGCQQVVPVSYQQVDFCWLSTRHSFWLSLFGKVALAAQLLLSGASPCSIECGTLATWCHSNKYITCIPL